MELLVLIPNGKQSKKPKFDTEEFKSLSSLILKPIEHISYHTDTITETTSTLLFYCNGNITRLYKDGDNRYKMQLPYFAHENWHHHNDKLRYRYCKKLSAQEYVKLCIWDEISANLCAILTARYEYLYAQNNKAVIKNYEKTYMRFYFNAIKSGKIKPSTEGISEKECKLLINGTKNMWLKSFWPIYTDKIIKKLNTHIDIFGLTEGNNPQYIYLRNQMLSLGGINFGNYLNQDIIIKNKTVLSIEQLYKVNSFKKDWKDIAINITQYEEKLTHLSVQQQKNFIKHIVISTKIKQILSKIDIATNSVDQPIVKNIYSLVEQDLQKDNSFITWLYSIKPQNHLLSYYDPQTYYKECIKGLYTYNNIDLINIIGEEYILKPEISHQYNFTTHPLIHPEIYTSFKELAKTPDAKTSSNYSTSKETHKSSTQYIDLPNFSQPILTSSNYLQKEQIKQTIRNFENIPQVLKECDTKAQIKFLNQQSLTR